MCPSSSNSVYSDRRHQILEAALRCFARQGFHQTTMHHISNEADISVGLIYRYFENKEAVIAGMADAHKNFINETLAKAKGAPSLLEALDIFFSASCCEDSPAVQAAFLVDLFAEASRNSHVAGIIRNVNDEVKKALVDLVESAPEARPALQKFTAVEIAELICAVQKGMAMLEILSQGDQSIDKRLENQIQMVRNLCRMLFSEAPASGASTGEQRRIEYEAGKYLRMP